MHTNPKDEHIWRRDHKDMAKRPEFTVLGASGFVGGHLADYLKEQKRNVYTPSRSELDDGSYLEKELAQAFYCIGITADFRKRPLDTVEAHVSKLLELIKFGKFESLIYLSSTRIYQGSPTTLENQAISVDPTDSDHLYDISKLMGESLCLSIAHKSIRIARLSNVVGGGDTSDNFLNAVIRDALVKSRVTLKTSLDSSKDYIHVGDVVRILPDIAARGKHIIYNVASGSNITNRALMNALAEITGCTYDVMNDPRLMVFPQISIKRLNDEFQYDPANVLSKLDGIIHELKREYNDGNN